MFGAQKKGPTNHESPLLKKALIKYHFFMVLSNMRC